MVKFKKSNYVPEKGDIVWLDFDPQKGYEQKGYRPGLIITGKRYNKHGLCLVCPITSKVKGYPFEVSLTIKGTKGVVLVDQIKAQDWRQREVQFIDHVNKTILYLVKQKLLSLMET